ncbi:uncharacterized protein JCM15063_001165 [Sporobolomyces koalae]|uniref:uncharacterized protein n=1 Tax=Sporobolomyces koalae TaxID=500713 RepID=UPI003180792C
MAFSTPRRPRRTREDTFVGEEALEITLFAEKKVWIQDKTTFLSTLPLIVVHDPLPPKPSETTEEQLRKWGEEQEAIEKEVNEFDYGDLNKMRTFAKQTSKHELSTRDTDLIEMCLTTIFALDKLLSLLRQRRKSLVLLGYRLQWEATLKAAWESRRQLLDAEIPAFLDTCRWSTPAEPLTKGVIEGEPEPAVSTSAAQLSSRGEMIIPDASSLEVSRAIYVQALQVSYSQLKAHVRRLCSSQLPQSSTLLDKLIDNSPTPIPEEFLDEQDRIEETIKRELVSNDLTRYLGARVEQWKQSDEVFCNAAQAEKDAKNLDYEVEVEFGRLRNDLQRSSAPQVDWIRQFEERIAQIDAKLEQTRETLDSLNRYEFPSTIARLDGLSAENEMARHRIETLEHRVARARGIVQGTRTRIQRFSRGVHAVMRGNTVRERLQTELGLLRTLQDRLLKLDPPRHKLENDRISDLDQIEDRTKQEEEYEKRFDEILSESWQTSFKNTESLHVEGRQVVAELVNLDIAFSLKTAVKAVISASQEAKEAIVKLKTTETSRRKRVADVRGTLRIITTGHESVALLRAELKVPAERSGWEPETNGSHELPDTDADLLQIGQSLRQMLEPFSRIDLSTLDKFLIVSAHLSSFAASVRREVEELDARVELVVRTRTQTRAVKRFEEELKGPRAQLAAILQLIRQTQQDELFTKLTAQETYEQLDKQFQEASRHISDLVDNVHLQIPFLSTSTSTLCDTASPLSLFETTSRDEKVRSHLNLLCSGSSRDRDEARKRLDDLKALIDTPQQTQPTNCDKSGMESKTAEDDRPANELLKPKASGTKEVTELSNATSALESLGISASALSEPASPRLAPRPDCQASLSQGLGCERPEEEFDDIERPQSQLACPESPRHRDSEKRSTSEDARKELETHTADNANPKAVTYSSGKAGAPKPLISATTDLALRPANEIITVAGVEPPRPDPFALSSSSDGLPELLQLRAQAEHIHTRNLLSDENMLRLPNQQEARELLDSLASVKQNLATIKMQLGHANVSSELCSVEELIRAKEDQVNRIVDLAQYSSRVDAADHALSSLLNSIDATESTLQPVLEESPRLAVTPLAEAIAVASAAVDSARRISRPLSDDRRVTQAQLRIEESWAEMSSMAEEAQPRSRSASLASSRSSRTGRTSTGNYPFEPSRSLSRSSSTSSTASLQLSRSRPLSRSSVNSTSRPSSPGLSMSRSSSSQSIVRDSVCDSADPFATPRRRPQKSGLPRLTPRLENKSAPPMTPSSSRPFSFSTTPQFAAKTSIPRRTPGSTPRRIEQTNTAVGNATRAAAAMRRVSSTSSRASSHRDSLASSVSSRRSSGALSTYRRPSLSPENVSRIGYRSSPRRDGQKRYRANPTNKLDREVGSIVNALDIHVPIAMADGKWSDESGMYRIGDKVYFCRILRSKQVMVRVGGGYQNLLQFIITHFAPAATVNISPTTPVKRTFAGSEPQWISSAAVRDQLLGSPSTSSMQSFLSSSTSSSEYLGGRSMSMSVSTSMRRSISSSSNMATPLRRSSGDSVTPLSPMLSASLSGRNSRQRPPIPVWKP